MPASHIIILVLAIVLIALALFTVHEINVREEEIALLEDKLSIKSSELRVFTARCDRLNRRYTLMYAPANNAEERVLSRSIFDEVAGDRYWLRFPGEPGAAAKYVGPGEAEFYDAALNSHEVK